MISGKINPQLNNIHGIFIDIFYNKKVYVSNLEFNSFNDSGVASNRSPETGIPALVGD